jgi:hypothetical protein
MASLERSRKARVKPTFYPGVKHRVLVGHRVALLSRIYCGGQRGVVWVPGAIILAMPTLAFVVWCLVWCGPSCCALPVVCALRSSSIGNECVAD